MKRKIMASVLIVVFLLSFIAGCKKPNDPALEGALAGEENAEQVPSKETMEDEVQEILNPDLDESNENNELSENKDDLNQVTDSEELGSLESVEEEKEEKKYCTATLEDNFEPGKVLVHLTKAYSDPYIETDMAIFSCVNYESVTWRNEGAGKTLAETNPEHFSKYRKYYVIVLKEKTKQAVLDAIKQLEQLDCVLMASPNNIHTVPADESAEPEPSFETANTT